MNPEISDAPYALVVDDNHLIRTGVVEILEEAGFRVMEAEHGDAGYALLRIHNPDFVLLFTDVQMPGELDGFSLAHKVAAAWPHIAIVVASGDLRPGPGAMPDKARFIGKPFSAQVVRTHVQEILPDGQKPAPLRRTKLD